MPRRTVRPFPLILGLLGLAVAGTAAAYLIRGNRDVTTPSQQAYRAYHEGLENDLKMYEREAMSAYAEALRYDPHFVMATLKLAEHMRPRDPDRAKSLLDSAARSRDQVSPRERLLLDIYQEWWGARDMKKLEALYDEYLRRYPKDPEGYRMRCEFLSMRGRTQEAIQGYEKLVTINPNYAIAYNTIGYYWASKGDTAKAEDNLKRYRYLAPNDANPYDSLGELYAHAGRYEEAEENLRKAIAIKDDFFPAYGHLGTVEAGRGHYPEAAEWFRKAAANTDALPIQHDFRFLAAAMLVYAGRIDDAVRAIDTQIADTAALPATKDVLRVRATNQLRRAAILGRIGRTAEAEAALASVDLASFDDPKEPGAKKELDRNLKVVRGVIASGAGRDVEAVSLLADAIETKSEKGLGMTSYYPDESFARLTLARSLGRLGRVDEAQKALAPLLEKNPHFAPALEMLARVRGEKPATAASSASARRAGATS